jgi:hypothetical protein
VKNGSTKITEAILHSGISSLGKMRKVSQAPWGRCSPLKIPEKDMLASLCMEAQDPQPCFSDLMHFVLYHMPIDGFDSQINWLRCNKLNMNMLQPTHWIKMSHWSIVCFAIKTQCTNYHWHIVCSLCMSNALNLSIKRVLCVLLFTVFCLWDVAINFYLTLIQQFRCILYFTNLSLSN